MGDAAPNQLRGQALAWGGTLAGIPALAGGRVFRRFGPGGFGIAALTSAGASSCTGSARTLGGLGHVLLSFRFS
jgi:hypothetical protein